MKRLLIVAFSLISAAPVYAQGEQPNIPKLKADAQKVVSIISGDKAKTEACRRITDLGGPIVQAAQEKDEKKAEALMQRINEWEKILGPEYPASFEALYEADPNSKDVQDILLVFAMLDQSCPE